MVIDRSPLNGGLHIKQENMIPPDHHLSRDSSDQMHHVIKREIHPDYEDVDESHGDVMAEDLTVSVDHSSTDIINA